MDNVVIHVEDRVASVSCNITDGVTGPQGPQGPQGDQGPPGPPGTLSVKTGAAIPGAFSGAPARATITFGTAFPNANYVILLGAVTPSGVNVEFNPQPENKTASGFVINLGTGRLDNLVEVGWQAIVY